MFPLERAGIPWFWLFQLGTCFVPNYLYQVHHEFCTRIPVVRVRCQIRHFTCIGIWDLRNPHRVHILWNYHYHSVNMLFRVIWHPSQSDDCFTFVYSLLTVQTFSRSTSSPPTSKYRQTMPLPNTPINLLRHQQNNCRTNNGYLSIGTTTQTISHAAIYEGSTTSIVIAPSKQSWESSKPPLHTPGPKTSKTQ